MFLNVKIFLRKNILLHTYYFNLKILVLKIRNFLKKKENLKFKIMMLESNFNAAHNYFEDKILNKNKFSLLEFCDFLSLTLRLKKFHFSHKLNKIILNYNVWHPIFYVFLNYNNNKKLLNKWLEKVFKNDQFLISILKYPDKFSKNEKIFISEILKNKTKLPILKNYIKEITSQMFFNDMQFNKLNSFFILDHMIADFLINKNKRKKKD